MYLLLVSLLSVISLGFFPHQDFSWKVYSSAEGLFAAEMPGELKTSIVVTDTPKSRLLTHIVSATDEELNEYMVSWTQYDRDSIEHRATEATFNRMRDALVAAKQGTIVNEPAITMRGHPARAVNFTHSNGRVVQARFYFVQNRIYQVVFESRSNDYPAERERFFNSFNVLDKN